MGLHDRDYMRPERGGFLKKLRRSFAVATAAHWAVGALVAAGLIQFMLTVGGHGRFIQQNLELTLDGLRAGKVWELFTYAFIHGGFWHLCLNALGIWFIGRGVYEQHGSKKFWHIFFGGILAGAIGFIVLWSSPILFGNAPAHMALGGASAGLFALMAYDMADKLHEEYGIPGTPIILEAYWFLGVTAVISLCGLFFTEIPVSTGVGFEFISKLWPGLLQDTMCHSAHLAGLALGFGWRFAEMKLPEIRAAKTRKAFTVLDKNAVQPASKKSSGRLVTPAVKPLPGDLRGEVDRILDKINAQGFGALTREEREILEKARETLSR